MGYKKQKADFTIRSRKFKVNKLLNRKQFVVELNHPHWCGTVPAKVIRKKLAQMYRVGDENTISLFGFKAHFGGGKTSGFALIYDDLASLKRIEPNYRLRRLGMGRKKPVARRSLKDRKNRDKKVRGLKKGKQVAKKKK